MLDLNSPTWGAISASPGGTGTLAAQLLGQVEAGDMSAYAELHHQLCHQFTVGAVAYVAVPHLVRIASDADAKIRVILLSLVGTVAAARLAHPASAASLREDWRGEYMAANAEALHLAVGSLDKAGLDLSDSQELLATIAALHGHTNLAMYLFLQGGVTELSCPVCGEVIEFGEAADA